jgi:hypothetical protein
VFLAELSSVVRTTSFPFFLFLSKNNQTIKMHYSFTIVKGISRRWAFL